MLAQRADEILRQRVAFIYIPAYFAHESLFVVFGRPRFRFDVVKIILVGNAGLV